MLSWNDFKKNITFGISSVLYFYKIANEILSSGLIRKTHVDMVLSGYEIPAHSIVQYFSMLNTTSTKHFKDPLVFKVQCTPNPAGQIPNFIVFCCSLNGGSVDPLSWKISTHSPIFPLDTVPGIPI